MPHIAIIQFPGSNCETETLRAVRNVNMSAEEFSWNRPPNDLVTFDGYIIVGGFSYEDRSRSGIIAALDPLIPYLKREAEKGKPVLGICNGAQILVETGLVPGLKNYAVGMALAENKRVQNGRVLGTGYYNAWVNMKLSTPPHHTAFTRCFEENEIMSVPIAHGEGRFIIPTELLKEMQQNKQTTFRYSDEQGGTNDEFPTNPNGAVYNLAAVSNPEGTILAMMPHPERRPDMGRAFFTSMKEYIIDKKNIPKKSELIYTPPQATTPLYQLPKNAFTITTQLIITDNEAKTVETTLKKLGLAVGLEKMTQWEMCTDDQTEHSTLPQKIISSGELFNTNKEKIIEPKTDKESILLLVRYKEDFAGQQKKQSLNNRFNTTSINSIKKGLLWKITFENGDRKDTLEKIIKSTILFNQFSQECLIYSSFIT